MARHLMAVCVVCLLCADHLPCKEHIENTDLYTKQQPNTFLLKTDEINLMEKKSFDDRLYTTINDDSVIYDKRKEKRKNNEEILNRRKRHSDHHHHDEHDEHINEPNKNSKNFLEKLFKQFGDSEKLTMNINGFENLLKHLNLYSLITNNTKTDDDNCVSSIDLVKKISNDFNYETTKLISNGHEHHELHEHNSINEKQKINNKSSINELDQLKETVQIKENDLWSICPILLYQLAATTSLERSGCIKNDILFDETYNNHQQHINEVEDRNLVWLYASLSIFGVSLCGLLGVAVIPFMEKHYYNHVLQFFVSLAVGTLCGDALLHLLPHAMITFAKDENGHEKMVWVGFIAVVGIIAFFFMERALTMIAEWRKKRQKKERLPSRVRVMRDTESTDSTNKQTGEKLCKDKYSSYPYCYDEIAMETKDNHHHHHGQNSNHNNVNKTSASSSPIENKKLNHNHHNNDHHHNHHHHDNHNETVQSLLSNNHLTINDEKMENNHEQHNNVENNTVSSHVEDTNCENHKAGKAMVPEESYTIILREHQSKHHGHSHTHGHVHSPPSSLSAVAWMVVMGDGLHNFTDGMAIGAAFSNNILGGFSTAIAVFCHELPHELGDFAVLLKAGMSAKTAVYYNLLSSVLSFFGMALGVFIGHTPEASAWIFATAAGLFLYIALVDMMPEITSPHKESCAKTHCFLQVLGMSLGLVIMLLIALYEHDLVSMFN